MQAISSVVSMSEFWSCSRKIPYRSRKAVKDAISRMRRLKHMPAMEYYRCATCGCFHLTKDRG